MTLRVGAVFSDSLSISLASALGFEGDEISAEQLADARHEAFECQTPETFAWHYLRGECLSKFQVPGVDLATPALRSFMSTEQSVALVNARLVDPWSRPWLDSRSFARARCIVHEILGRFPWEKFPRVCNFGSGASVGKKRTQSQKQNKWDSSSHITEAALPYHHAFTKWSLRDDLPKAGDVCGGNRVTTVPKSWKTDRTIAIEPDWNMFYQKGCGALIRHRLQRCGLLRPDAQSIAQRMAQEGSLTGRLATIDLAAASDSVSLALCELLLPADWFKVLTDLRSPAGTLDDGKVVTYEKISSMGNGFTFELETLLFYALTLAVCGKGNRESVHVYGDDIICPTEHAPEVMMLLFEAGFQVNEDKTFIDGAFRESCGGHYFMGKDVSPFYHRRHIGNILDVINLANHIISWNARLGNAELDELGGVYRTLARKVPKKLRGPYLADGCLWSEWDVTVPKWNRDFQSWKTQRLIGVMDEPDPAFASKKGSLLMSLWEGNDELEASVYRSPLSGRVRTTPLYTYRDQWHMLPVRIA